MAMRDIDDVVRELEGISEKLDSSKYGENIADKLDKVNDKLDRMIRIFESIERKLGGSSY